MTAPARRSLAALAGFALFVVLASVKPASADAIAVVLDQARLVKLPDKVATIVIGNPLIADVTIQGAGIGVITGKGYGVTNFIALDRDGKTLMESSIVVRAATDRVVVMYKGVERETYSCAPDCERRIALGDSQQYFNVTITQTAMRNTVAQGPGATK
jgi:Flp pilus assembly secretin CpaC